MRIKVPRNEFKDFLMPISRISEGTTNTCALYIEKDYIYTLSHTPDIVCIYYAKFKPLSIIDFDVPFTIYIADIKKVLTALSAIDEDEIELTITDKCISYTSSTTKFKCYLLDSAVASVQKISAARIDELSFDTEFVIDGNSFTRINKGCVFTDNTGKIYFYTNEDKVYVDIDDKSAQHSVNNITFIASDSYSGSQLSTNTPLSIESFKIIGSLKNSVLTKVNIAKGVYMFYYKDSNIETKYIIRGLKS